MKTIYLIGLMGAGKTTVGEKLAATLGLPFFDVDQLVVEQAGKSIAVIFRETGEVGFRQLETEALKCLPIEQAVVATGGGIVEVTENRDWMRRQGIVIFLAAEVEEILARVGEDSGRPLLSHLTELSQSRKSLYEEVATFEVKTIGKKVEEVVQACLNVLQELD